MNKTEISSTIEVHDSVLDRVGIFCTKILKRLGKKNWEVSILICDDEYIRSLNRTYRGKDNSTDVLSFPQGEQPGHEETYYAGDVVVSFETCRRDAEKSGEDNFSTLRRLLVHGILHLDGYIHETEEDYNNMISIQKKLLTETGGEAEI